MEANLESPASRFSLNKLLVILFSSITILGTLGGIAYYAADQGENLEMQGPTTPSIEAPADAEQAGVVEQMVSKVEETIKSVNSVNRHIPGSMNEEQAKSVRNSAVKRLTWSRRNVVIIGAVVFVLLVAIAASMALVLQTTPPPEDAIIETEDPVIRTPEKTDEEILEDYKFTAYALKCAFTAVLGGIVYLFIACGVALTAVMPPWSFLNPWRVGNRGSFKDCWEKYKIIYITLGLILVTIAGIAYATWTSENTRNVLDIVATDFLNNLYPYALIICRALACYLAIGSAIYLTFDVRFNQKDLSVEEANARTRKYLSLIRFIFVTSVASIIVSIVYPWASFAVFIPLCANIFQTRIMGLQKRPQQ